MNTAEAIAYIHSVSYLGSKPGLSRTRELLSRMGNPESALRFVHIAGTNGKGSTAAMIESVLRRAGYKTGLFTSPYLARFTERMRINGDEISGDELAQITELVKPHADAMADSPTEFELVTAVAFEYFRQHGCDIVVLEVGMGGRLDSTNVIEAPETAVITAIGLDHVRELGDTVEKIAREKAGIIKPGADVVLYAQSPQVERVFADAARERGAASLTKPDFERIRLISADVNGQCFSYNGYEELRIALLGAHQRRNAALAVETVETLRRRGFRISRKALYEGLALARWPGRFEVIGHNPLFIVDGGHNPQCAESQRDCLAEYLGGEKAVFLMGVLRDKDYPAILDIIAPCAERFVTITPGSSRAIPAAELAAIIEERTGLLAEAASDIPDGVARARALAGDGGAVCAFGSLYSVGEIRACFGLE